MTLLFVRGFFFILSGIVGYQIGAITNAAVTGALYGLAGAALLILMLIIARSVYAVKTIGRYPGKYLWGWSRSSAMDVKNF